MNIYDFQKAANQSYAARLADVVSDLQVLNDRVQTSTNTEIERVRLEHAELISFLNTQLESKIEAMTLTSHSLQKLVTQSIDNAAETRTKILDGEITLPEAREVDILPAEFQGLLTEPGNDQEVPVRGVMQAYNARISLPEDSGAVAIANRFGAGPRRRN